MSKKPIGHDLPDYKLDPPEDRDDCDYCDDNSGLLWDDEGSTPCPKCNPQSAAYKFRRAWRRKQ